MGEAESRLAVMLKLLLASGCCTCPINGMVIAVNGALVSTTPFTAG